MNKKGEGSIIVYLIGVALILVTFYFVARAYGWVGDQAEGGVSQIFCRWTNEIKSGTIKEKAKEVFGSPQGCKRLEEDTPLPSGDYLAFQSQEYGLKTQIGDMAARCWWMWLEGVTNDDGKSADVLDEKLTSNKDCFLCYTFTVRKNLQIKSGDLAETLATQPYKIVDGSNKCGKNGGGYCAEKCDLVQKWPKDTPVKPEKSDKCRVTEWCCLVDDPTNECLNRGGRCRVYDQNFFSAEGTIWARTDRWPCATGSCFVPKSQFVSYVDYIQEGGLGPGILAFSPDVQNNGLTSDQVYAIVFNEDTSAEFTRDLIGGGVVGTAGVAVGILVLGASAPVSIAVGVIGSVVGYNTLSLVQGLFEGNTHDEILIAKLDEVQDKCAIQYGTSGK